MSLTDDQRKQYMVQRLMSLSEAQRNTAADNLQMDEKAELKDTFGFALGFASACEYMSSRQGQWISVNDQLPKESTPENRNIVLIWFNAFGRWGVNLGEISVGHWRPISGNGNFDDQVTHWMPLPTPPTTDKPSAEGEK